MRYRFVALLCACMMTVVSGCVEQSPSPQIDPSGAAPAVDPLSWEASVDGSVVLRFTIEGGPKTSCTLFAMTHPVPGTKGWSSFVLEQGEGRRTGWMLQGGEVQTARVQVLGKVDSSSVLPADWYDGPLRVEWSVEDFTGPVTLTYGASGLVADDEPNISVRLECVGEHRVASLEGGRDLSFFEIQSSRSGVTAGVSHLLAPAAGVLTQVVHESKAPTVRFLFACSYFLLRGQLSSPDGSLPIACDPNPVGPDVYYERAGSPGSWSLTVNEADPFDGGSWGIIYGTHPIVALNDLEALPHP